MKKIKVFVRIFFIMVLGVIGVSNVDAQIYGCSGTNCARYIHCSTSWIGPTSQSLQKKYFVLNRINASDDTFEHYVTYTSNGHYLYCTERGVFYMNHENSSDNPAFKQTSANVNSNLVARVLAYGYYNDSVGDPECSSAVVATQMLVWMAQKQTEDGGFDILKESSISKSTLSSLVTGSGASSVVNQAYSVLQSVRNHEVLPSFAYSSLDAANKAVDKLVLKYNETNRNFSGSVTDSKSVFSGYTVGTTPTGVTVSKNNNTLTITSKNDSVTTPISMTKSFPSTVKINERKDSFVQTTVYKSNPTSKTVTGYTPYTYEAIGKGIIKIHKIDKRTSGNIKGIKFGIYSDDGCTKTAVDYLGNELSAKTTDKNGFVSWDNLYYPLKLGESRTYYVKELSTLEGYALDNAQLEQLNAKGTCIPVKITASEKEGSTTKEVEAKEEVVQDIYNIPYGNVTIMKQDEETGKVIEGVEFKLLKNNTKKEPATDMDGKVVENAITDKNGIAEFKNIPYGDYILVEVKANDYYKVLEEPVEFTLDKENDALKYEAQGTEALPDDKSDSKDILIPLEKYRLGDPTNDGKIDAEDINVVESIIKGTSEEKGLEFYASDVNLDNTVNETDKELMQKYLDGDTTAIPNALKEYDLPGQVQKRVSIVVTNKPIDMKVSKLELTKEKELKGAKIVIKNSKGEVFIKYTSTDKVKEFAIPVGDYTLIETVAPKGYQTLKTEVKFRVLSNGNLKLISAKSNMYKLVKSKEKNDTDLDHLKIYNNLKKISAPKTGSVIAISTIVFGIALVGAGSYIIYRRYKNS